MLSMPRLWSTLFVRTGHQPYRWIKDPIQEAKNILTDFTAHACGRALTVHLSLVCDHEREIPDSYAKTYNFLGWVLYKWPLISNVQHLTILSVYAWKDILVVHGPLSLPNLETLILTTHRRRQESPPEDTRFWIEGIFNNSPRLRQITLDRGVLSMPHKFLPLSQLESLILEDPITASTFWNFWTPVSNSNRDISISARLIFSNLIKVPFKSVAAIFRSSRSFSVIVTQLS